MGALQVTPQRFIGTEVVQLSELVNTARIYVKTSCDPEAPIWIGQTPQLNVFGGGRHLRVFVGTTSSDTPDAEFYVSLGNLSHIPLGNSPEKMFGNRSSPPEKT